tara:strand:+ start:4362 stop:5198 length:837 start_codon:yes stop_codon:yes gene_type:complete
MCKVLLSLVFCAVFACNVQAQKVKYWLEPNGHMAEISSQETHRRIDEALVEIEKICDIDFIKVSDARRAKVRYYFRPQNQIPYGALGLAVKSKRYILLNSTRKIGLTRESGDRYVQTVAQHEMLHMLRWKHSSDESSVMHPYTLPKFFNRTDVYWLQKKFGKHRDRVNNQTGAKGRKNRDGIPDQVFIPPTLAKWGKRHREDVVEGQILHEERDRLIAERDSLTDPVARTIKQEEVLESLDKILAHNIKQVASGARWHMINLYWIGTYGYYFDYYPAE